MGLDSLRDTFKQEAEEVASSQHGNERAIAKSELWVGTFDKLAAIYDAQDGRAIKVGVLAVFGYPDGVEYGSADGTVVDAPTYVQLWKREVSMRLGSVGIMADYCIAPPEGFTLHRGPSTDQIVVGTEGQTVMAHSVYGEREEYYRWAIRNVEEPMKSRVYASGTGDKFYPTTYSLEDGHYFAASPNGETWRWRTEPDEFIQAISRDLEHMTKLVATLDGALTLA